MAHPIPSPFEWDNSFCIKVESLNNQHKGLFTAINDLDKHRDGDHVAKLSKLVVDHFKAEEELFAKHHYKESDSHKATHDKFLADFTAVKSIGDAEIQWAKSWLVNHIKGSDAQYAEFLHSHGAH